MDPVSALVIAWILTQWCTARGAAGAALGQARAEGRTAASAIRNDLHGRGEAWAKQLANRLANGRSGGPSTGLWWGWAALKTARALRNALTREPRDGEKAKAVRDKTGPGRRIWDAGTRGARYAREETARQRKANQKPTPVPLDVCEQCGAVVARTALVLAPTSSGAMVLTCVQCRNDPAHRPEAEATREDTERPAPGPDDAGAPAIAQPRPELTAPEAEPAGPAPEAPQPQPAPAPIPVEPAPPTVEAPVSAPDPLAAPQARPALSQPPKGETIVAPRTPGQVVPYTRTPARQGNGGESYTHGQWVRAVTDIEKRLDDLPAVLEAMLRSLNSADAGRAQVQGVIATRKDILMFMEEVRAMLAEVNRRENPVLDAIDAAGGPDEVPGIPYLAEV